MADGDAVCQYCRKDCGNAGARTQHESACPENPANEGADRGGSDIERANAARARPEPSGQGAGETAGDLLFTLTHADQVPPEAKAEAVQEGLGLLGNIVQRYQALRFRNEQRIEQRAQRAELQPAEAYPQCPKCEYQFGPEDLGSEELVRCPECDQLWEIEVPEPSEA